MFSLLGPIRIDGKNEPVKYGHEDYDLEKTKDLIKTMFEDSNVHYIIFNDPKVFGDPDVQRSGLILRDPPGTTTHDNHIHVVYKE